MYIQSTRFTREIREKAVPYVPVPGATERAKRAPPPGRARRGWSVEARPDDERRGGCSSVLRLLLRRLRLRRLRGLPTGERRSGFRRRTRSSHRTDDRAPWTPR